MWKLSLKALAVPGRCVEMEPDRHTNRPVCFFWKAEKTRKRAWHGLDMMKKMRPLHNHEVGLFLQCEHQVLCDKQPTVSTVMNPCIHTKYKIIHASTCKYFKHHKEVFLFIAWLSGLSVSLFIHFLSRSVTLLPAQRRLLFYFVHGGREWNARMYDWTPTGDSAAIRHQDIQCIKISAPFIIINCSWGISVHGGSLSIKCTTMETGSPPLAFSCKHNCFFSSTGINSQW